MKKTIKVITKLMMIILCWGTSQVWASEEGEECKLVAGFDNTAPFHYLNTQNEVVGRDADILRAIAREIDCEIHFQELPWSRTLSYVEQGKVDIAIGAGFKESRAQWGYYSSPYKFIDHRLYTKKQHHVDVDSLEQFFANKLKLGTMLGWGYPPEVRLILEKPEFKQQVIPVSQFPSLIKMLKADRVDGIMAIPDHLKRELYGHPDLALFRARAHYQEALHFIFSKKSVSPELVARFNNALFKFDTTDQRKQILDKYPEQ